MSGYQSESQYPFCLRSFSLMTHNLLILFPGFLDKVLPRDIFIHRALDRLPCSGLFHPSGPDSNPLALLQEASTEGKHSQLPNPVLAYNLGEHPALSPTQPSWRGWGEGDLCFI